MERNHSVNNTQPQHAQATVNMDLPEKDSPIPISKANSPDRGFVVASMIAGNVITAMVT